jgi:hypothetical protein
MDAVTNDKPADIVVQPKRIGRPPIGEVAMTKAELAQRHSELAKAKRREKKLAKKLLMQKQADAAPTDTDFDLERKAARIPRATKNSAAMAIARAHWSKERTHKVSKSRVSNGADLMIGIDGRSVIARRYRDISSAILQDLGGLSECSEALVQVVRRFAAVACLCENLEAKLINGEPVSAPEHALLCSTLCKLGQRIGLRRLPRSVQTPSLAEYLIDLGKEREEQPDADQEAAE